MMEKRQVGAIILTHWKRGGDQNVLRLYVPWDLILTHWKRGGDQNERVPYSIEIKILTHWKRGGDQNYYIIGVKL